MNVGLPGLGLSGLFFTLCALAMPFVELGRTLRRRGSRERWRRALQQFGLAAAMVGVYVGMGALASLASRRLFGTGADEVLQQAARVVPTRSDGSALAPVVVTAAVLATLLLVVRLAGLARRKPPESRR